MAKFRFKEKFTESQRKEEAARITAKYPNRIPVICERHVQATGSLPEVDKRKYLVPDDLTIGQFIYVIRKRIRVSPEQAIFLLVNGTLPNTQEILSSMYEKYQDEDGFLYVHYMGENTFGI
jgi:GABA(A) receptor-associated protein